LAEEELDSDGDVTPLSGGAEPKGVKRAVGGGESASEFKEEVVALKDWCSGLLGGFKGVELVGATTLDHA